jgi:hypothetical protein
MNRTRGAREAGAMQLPRMTTRRWMAAAATVAVLLALPPELSVLLMLPATVIALILVPAALAPRRRRIEVACWAAALHPLALLAWLAAWRFSLDPRPL